MIQAMLSRVNHVVVLIFKSMRRILKYELNIHCDQIIEFGGIARILCVGVQRNKPYLWADVDEHLFVKEKKRIMMFNTGEEIPRDLFHKTKYIGTIMLNDNSYVGHVYQIIE